MMDRNTFYTVRDNRTDRCVASIDYQRRCVCVTVDPALAGGHGGQVLTIAACDLLARWCRTIRLVMPDVPLVPALRWMGDNDLRACALQRMKVADPFGDFAIAETPIDAELQLVIGNPSPMRAASGKATHVGGAGWVAAIQRQPLADLGAPNVLASLFAAALGVGQVFSDALGIAAATHGGLFLDTFHLTAHSSRASVVPAAPPPAVLELGRLLCVGAGSVATSTLYGLALLGARARVVCVDGDEFKLENLARSLACAFGHVTLPKPIALQQGLLGSGIDVIPRLQWWDEYTRQFPHEPGTCDVWLPLANERNVRHAMQAAAAPLMVQSSTTSSWGCSFGRHLPGKGDCLAERFPAGTVTAAMGCASGPVPADNGDRVDAALPFMSLLAGALSAAELARLQMPGYPQVPNMVNLDLGAPVLVPQRLERARAARCPHCVGNVAAVLRAATRYGHLYAG